jgi:signal transduction histidine kinase
MLRDAGDVVVLHAPSWWTPERTYAALLGVLALAVAALSWAAALRRTVAKQTRQLAAEMRGKRDAAVGFQAALRERSRLAANLHDTVLQTMTGIAYQIEACESESLPAEQRAANHLETARRMVQRGQEDLRNSVWALRALPMKEATFPDAVQRVARQIAAGNPAEIRVETEGELPALADFIAGNLLLIVQEAVHNAIKHAMPEYVRVVLSSMADGKRLALRVEDDGSGFETGRQPGAGEGHFGLVGMRERAESLGGTIDLQSEPGKGTRLRVEVPIRSFDHDLD